MKNLLFFSNPFGYGPSGKALSVAEYIHGHTEKTKIILCGSQYFSQIAGKQFSFLNIDDRNEESILQTVKTIPGEKYIFSSQNRFAIKVATRIDVPSAFLDGLAWFWDKIPGDHFLADIILWLNYPYIEEKIPQKFKNKIHIIHGVTEPTTLIEDKNRYGIVMYIGGCKNPLTPLPYSYLDLISKLFEFIDPRLSLELSTDEESQAYLSKNRKVSERIKRYDHNEFVEKLSKAKRFVSNGGQTATLEASTVRTPISFFLPINLSQLALIRKLNSTTDVYPHLSWEDYTKLPKNIDKLTEKEVLILLEAKSRELMNNPIRFGKLCKDFLEILSTKGTYAGQAGFFKQIGSTGAGEVCKILKNEWNLS